MTFLAFFSPYVSFIFCTHTYTKVLFNFLDDTTQVSPIETPKDPDSNAISLADFDLIRVIGRGSYAKVLMVELKKTKRIYAMKVIKKELVTDDEVSRTMQ